MFESVLQNSIKYCKIYQTLSTYNKMVSFIER